MTLPPYTLDPLDEDLRDCGCRLSGEGPHPSSMTRTESWEELDARILETLLAIGAVGVSGRWELARLVDSTPARVETALRRIIDADTSREMRRALRGHNRLFHPRHAPPKLVELMEVELWSA